MTETTTTAEPTATTVEVKRSTETTELSTTSSTVDTKEHGTTTTPSSSVDAHTSSDSATMLKSSASTIASGAITTSTGSDLTCSVTNYVSTTICPIQSTGAASGQTLSCYPTTIATATCAPGLMCLTSPDGNDGCMIAQGMSSEGIVVFLVLGFAALTGVIGVCFASQREKRRQSQLQQQWEVTQIKSR